MAAILDSGFDDPAPHLRHGHSHTNGHAPSPLQRAAFSAGGSYANESPPIRYAPPHMNGTTSYEVGQYVPMESGMDRVPGLPNSGDSVSSSVERSQGGGHAKKRSGGVSHDNNARYGPLGPLTDDTTGWGQRQAPPGGRNGHKAGKKM